MLLLLENRSKETPVPLNAGLDPLVRQANVVPSVSFVQILRTMKDRVQLLFSPSGFGICAELEFPCAEKNVIRHRMDVSRTGERGALGEENGFTVWQTT
jgi:hypothetical protein